MIDAVPLEIKSRFYHESEINLFVSSKKFARMVLILSQILVNHNNEIIGSIVGEQEASTRFIVI